LKTLPAAQDRARIADDCRMIDESSPDAASDSCTLYSTRRCVIECPAPSTTICLAMKNSIILISALSLAAMMLASCNSIFAPDETATTGVTPQSNETPPERSGNSISAGAY
jgi:hypothetical protein